MLGCMPVREASASPRSHADLTKPLLELATSSQPAIAPAIFQHCELLGCVLMDIAVYCMPEYIPAECVPDMDWSPINILVIKRLICLQEKLQAAQAEKAQAEDSHSSLTFEVEVVHFQAYLQAEMVPGRFLLAAERGKVEGRSLAQLGQNVTMLDLDQVGC